MSLFYLIFTFNYRILLCLFFNEQVGQSIILALFWLYSKALTRFKGPPSWEHKQSIIQIKL